MESTAPAGRADHDMMHRYLLSLVDRAAERWQAEYEARTEPEQIAAYQADARRRLLEVLGGLPERTPLNARTTGTIRREGYTVEKVILESQPGFGVTGLLFLPDPNRFPPPYPGVVEPVGHTGNGKAHGEYQSMGALLALNGMVALVYDAIDESERVQYRGERGDYDFDMWGSHLHGTYGHQMVGIGSILLGRNTARLEIWDTMRCIDYLQSRPEVNPDRIGCTGNSGGGIVTAYVVALDDRVGAAAPSCYGNALPTLLKTLGPQDAEHHTYASLADAPQATDLLMMRAPVPILLCAGTKDFFHVDGSWWSFRCAKRLYTRLGFAERMDILENDAPHNYNRTQREGIARWMARWLQGEDRVIREPELALLTDDEARCTPTGQVMDLPGARSAYDLNDEYERELAARRVQAWAGPDRAERIEGVRRLLGIPPLDNLPVPEVRQGEQRRTGGMRVHDLTLHPEPGIVLPACLYGPEGGQPAGRVVLYVHEAGREADAGAAGPIEALVRKGARVLAVEVRGTGLSQQVNQNKWGKIDQDWKDISIAYCLGRSYVGMRTQDVLAAAQWAAGQFGGEAVDLVAVGHVGVPALHAAALRPDLFASVTLRGTLASWASVLERRVTINQYGNVVQGALLEYDLPDLAGTLGRKLTIEDPRDATGQPVKA
ncbi:MAG: prolyl oligopeptidase family serine peptidase [Candidatus Brocadiaceae bacterium]|nr:prolyl oligopeptidase family serine peptidase [Candidatus Brocadiaceae bacterium]